MKTTVEERSRYQQKVSAVYQGFSTAAFIKSKSSLMGDFCTQRSGLDGETWYMWPERVFLRKLKQLVL